MIQLLITTNKRAYCSKNSSRRRSDNQNLTAQKTKINVDDIDKAIEINADAQEKDDRFVVKFQTLNKCEWKIQVLAKLL